MGYDLTVTKGNVRMAEARILIRELLEFAAQLDLEVIPINWMVSGIIADYKKLIFEFFGENVETQYLVSRTIIKKATENAKELQWFLDIFSGWEWGRETGRDI